MTEQVKPVPYFTGSFNLDTDDITTDEFKQKLYNFTVLHVNVKLFEKELKMKQLDISDNKIETAECDIDDPSSTIASQKKAFLVLRINPQAASKKKIKNLTDTDIEIYYRELPILKSIFFTEYVKRGNGKIKGFCWRWQSVHVVTKQLILSLSIYKVGSDIITSYPY